MSDLADAAADVMARLGQRRPLIHHIANAVVANDVANVTLFVGAAPVMAEAIEEVAEMVGHAAALALNLGLPSPARIEAMLAAGRAANARGIPVVIDPVGAGATTFRTRAASRLLGGLSVAAIRGNSGEIGVLAGSDGQVRGVDGISSGGDPAVAAVTLARRSGAVVAITGARDFVTDGVRLLVVDNGHPLLTSISGTGCMATAVLACCAAVEPDRLLAAVTALAAFGLAGERAAARAAAPGSFKVALFDTLAGLVPADLAAEARIAELEVAV